MAKNWPNNIDGLPNSASAAAQFPAANFVSLPIRDKRVSGRSVLITTYLALLLFILPAIKVFGFAPEYVFNSEFALSRYLNFASLGVAFALSLLMPSAFSRRLFGILALFFSALCLNYFFTDYASGKWFLNWIGFLFIFASASHAFLHMDRTTLYKLERTSNRALIVIAIFVSALCLYVWITHLQSLFWFAQSGMRNHVIALLTYDVGIEKQALGSLGAVLILFLIFFRKRLPKITIGLLLISLLLIAPALVGIRTLILGLGLFSLLAMILKTKNRIALVALMVGAPVLVYVFADWQSVMGFVSTVYDRWGSLLFAIDTAFKNPFGLGNGGYHVFVERYNDLIVSRFGSERMLERGEFWLAPESDLVYFIASWGVLSCPFFSLMGYVIYMSVRLIRKHGGMILPVEKLILAFTAVLFIMGISQDNAGGLLWWVYFGAAMGIIERYRRALIVEKRSIHQIVRQ